MRACAHRGDSAELRENTLPAIRSAIEKRADFVEIDVRLTADGDPVVLHDPTLQRLWEREGAIAHTSTAALAVWGVLDARPPLLCDVLPLFAETASVLVIDMDDARFAAPAHRVVAASGIAVQWCGDIDAMRALRTRDADAELWLPWRGPWLPSVAEIAELAPITVNAPFETVTQELVTTVHELGATVTVWTVDDESRMRDAIAMGVDTITTNRLDRLQRMLAEVTR